MEKVAKASGGRGQLAACLLVASARLKVRNRNEAPIAFRCNNHLLKKFCFLASNVQRMNGPDTE
jgi:hypothetical protein